MGKKSDILVLLSGGIDSTACLAYYINLHFSISALFVDYGQLSRMYESKAAEAVSKHYNIPLKKIAIVGGRKWKDGCILGRNAFLIYTGLMNFEYESGILALGIHKGTSYWDCSPDFINIMKSCFGSYTQGSITVDAPFLEWTKQEIWNYTESQKIPTELTYSCELGKMQPCGLCLSCKDLESLYDSQKK